jgi:hypothetical protein
MIVEPKAATEKWCPFRHTLPYAGEYNDLSGVVEDPVGINSHARCIGPDCMAWRWLSMRLDQDSGEYKAATQDGYCGLAGVPMRI